jgi:hypothetical protein
VSKHDQTSNLLLIDRGADGGISGNDELWISKVFIIISSHLFLLEPLVVLHQHKKNKFLPFCISIHFLVKAHPFTHHVNYNPIIMRRSLFVLLVVLNRLRLWMEMLYH